VRTTARTVLMLALLCSFATACGNASTGAQPADQQSACDQAFAQAIAIDPGADTVGALDGSIAQCPSLEAWVAAAARFPDTFDGQDPTAVADARCASAQLANTPVCVDLGAQ
jgi:hypothetical protein